MLAPPRLRFLGAFEMTGICGDFAIVLVPKVGKSGPGWWDRYPSFMSQHVSLCLIMSHFALFRPDG